MPTTYTLDNAAEIHRDFPETFHLPQETARASLQPGALVKLIFRIDVDDETHVERMWVQITDVTPGGYKGVLDNDPYCTDEIRSGMPVDFHADHIIEIYREPS